MKFCFHLLVRGFFPLVIFRLFVVRSFINLFVCLCHFISSNVNFFCSQRRFCHFSFLFLSFSLLSFFCHAELEKAEKIYEDIIAGHPKHLAAHLLLIQNIESSATELKASQYPFTFAKSLNANGKQHGSTTAAAATTSGMGTGTDATAATTATAAATTEDSSSTSSSDGAGGTAGSGSSSEDKQKEDNQKLRNALERIVLLADNVIRDTDKDALLAYYGIKCDTRPDAAKIKT